MIIYNDHRKEKPHKINDENFIINVINDHFRQIIIHKLLIKEENNNFFFCQIYFYLNDASFVPITICSLITSIESFIGNYVFIYNIITKFAYDVHYYLKYQLLFQLMITFSIL